jgi:hypothetical protein
MMPVMVGKEQLQVVAEVQPCLSEFDKNQMLMRVLEVCVVLPQCMVILEDLLQVEVVHHAHPQALAEVEGKKEGVEC